VIQHVLEYRGALVTAVADAPAALESLHLVQPHVIVSDLSLPRMDGITFLRYVRELPARASALRRRSRCLRFRRRCTGGGIGGRIRPVSRKAGGSDLLVSHVERLARDARGFVERHRYFECTYCGAQCPCPERLVAQYAARMSRGDVTLRAFVRRLNAPEDCATALMCKAVTLPPLAKLAARRQPERSIVSDPMLSRVVRDTLIERLVRQDASADEVEMARDAGA